MRTGTRVRRKAVLATCAVMALAYLVGISAPAGAQEEAPSAVQRLLALAPAGTWCALAVDMAQVLASEPMKQLRDLGAELPPQLTGMRAAAYFLLPTELPIGDDGPPWCAVVLVDPQTRESWESRLAEDGTQTALEGLAVYETGGGITGFADDELLLMARDKDSFAVVVKARRAGQGNGPGERLAELLQPHVSATVLGAAALPEPFGRMLPEEASEYLPSYLMGITDVAFSARLEQKLALSGFARMTSADDAREALTAAQEGLADMKEKMNDEIRDEPMVAFAMLPYFALLNSLKIEVREAEFHGSVELDPGQTALLGSTGMMLFYMFSDLGGHGIAHEYGEPTAEMDARLNLHEISLGIAMYQGAHKEEYPSNLAVLVDEGFIESLDVLTDPADQAPQPIGDTGIVSSYKYAGPLPRNVAPPTIVCYTRKGVRPKGRYVLSADMAVDFVTEEKLRDPAGPARTSLRASYEGVVAALGDALTEERRAELKKFYEIEE